MRPTKRTPPFPASIALALCLATLLAGCSATNAPSIPPEDSAVLEVSDSPASGHQPAKAPSSSSASQKQGASEPASAASDAASQNVARAKARIDLSEDYRESFIHGDKGPEFQKYIVLHDTEGEGDAAGVIDYWGSDGRGVAAHFVVNKDGSVVQCVPLDKIGHHAGYGDTGHDEKYGVEEDGRDDMAGAQPIGDWAADYGMNAWSVGIELVHVGGSGDYPEAQLRALDALVAYIDAYFGFESRIIDHKAWRTGNSDTSEEFASYLENYQDHRTHDPA